MRDDGAGREGMAEAGVGIFFCVSVERSRGGDLEGRTGRRLLKVGGVRV